MKMAYPITLSRDGKFIVVSVPDCRINTQGDTIVHAIEMARDAIAMWSLCELEDGRELPTPSDLSAIHVEEGGTVTLVDVDIESYRRKHETRTVRKNLTIPHWLNERAEQQHVNFSKILQDALIQHLEVDNGL